MKASALVPQMGQGPTLGQEPTLGQVPTLGQESTMDSQEAETQEVEAQMQAERVEPAGLDGLARHNG